MDTKWVVADNGGQLVVKCEKCGYVADSQKIPKECPKCKEEKERLEKEEKAHMNDGKIEITLKNDEVTVGLDGKMHLLDTTIALGSAMGIMLRGQSDNVVKELLEVFVAAMVDEYKGK